MINFFRIIRKRLLSENQFNKYLLYAIGEILLVVIGIIIALQINNWNQYKNDRKQEIEILKEIKSNLSIDLEDHHRNLGYLKHVVNSTKIVLEHLNNNLPYHDSLSYHFAWLPMAANFNSVNSGYKLLLSKGVNILTNDSLRQSITFIYETEYAWLTSFLKDRQYLNNSLLLNEMMKKFRTFELLKEAIPRDYKKLIHDDDFKVQVQQNGSIIKATMDKYLEKLLYVQSVIINIAIEIEVLIKKQ